MIISTFLYGSPELRLYSMTDGVTREEGTVPLQDIIDWAKYDPIWANRGKAIQGYADLERSLCQIFVATSGMTWEAAVTVFYKITNTKARNTILEKLLHQKCGSQFNIFWNPFIREITQIDLKRNEIVHWLAVANVLLNANKQILAGVTLIPPASVGANASTLHITSSDLYDFTVKCEQFSQIAQLFSARISPREGAPSVDETSLDIFQQPFVYPLPVGHPSLGWTLGHEIHPQSFPASLLILRPAADGQNLETWPS